MPPLRLHPDEAPDRDRDPSSARDYANLVDPSWNDLTDAELEAMADRQCAGLGLHFAVEN